MYKNKITIIFNIYYNTIINTTIIYYIKETFEL